MPGLRANQLAGVMIAAAVCAAGPGLLPGPGRPGGAWGPGTAVAGTIPTHPIPETERWATITHPGNEPYRYERPGVVFERGRVDYEYQISRTEVTHAEWLEFIQAYAPHADPPYPVNSMFTGQFIWPVGQSYYMVPQAANIAVEIVWDYAARYCNWLHNGKANTAEAFESGAYDTSTFTYNTDGTFNHQQMRSSGARYWIPSQDEWVKAGHFDPDRHGPGQPGYWIYPHSSDSPPVPGPPGVGQTNTGGPWLAVGSYTSIRSPWGLWDVSGGMSEWTETVVNDPNFPLPREWWIMGSAYRNHPLQNLDHIERGSTTWGLNPQGLRIARVPAPAGAIVFVLGIVLTTNRRR